MALVVLECRRKNRSSNNGSYLIADRTYTERWQIQTEGSDRAITAYDIEMFGENGEIPAAGSPLPRYGSLLNAVSGAVLKVKNANPINVDDISQWMVELTYGYITAEDQTSGGGRGQVNPTLRLPDIRRTTTEVQEAIEKVVDPKTGDLKPLVMSNGRPFPTLPTRTYYMPTLLISQYETTFSNTTASAVVGSVNSVQFLGFPARTIVCSQMDGQLVFWQEGQAVNTAVKTDYQFIHNKRGWTPGKYLARDYFEKVNGQLRPIVVNGAFVTEPWPLDALGIAIPPNLITDGFAESHAGTGAIGAYHYVEVDEAEEFDLNLLPLPYQYL